MGEKKLEEMLRAYAASDMYPFHMPGHKRQGNPEYRTDITEIDGFDNLHAPEGILREEMRRAAEFVGARETWFLVNGSTAGILTAISAAVPAGGRILIERGCHISVYHAAYLRNLKVSYLPEGAFSWEGSRESAVSAGEPGGGTAGARETVIPEDTDAVVITSPSYIGVTKNVRAAAEAAHRAGIPLIVDEAHGAHFSMHPYFPGSAVRAGADLVIQSTHKTLPAMTQTALLHNVSGRVSGDAVRKFLDIYETSSPSYVLMASVTEALHRCMEGGSGYFDEYVRRLKQLRASLGALRHLRLLDGPGVDPGKITVLTRGAGITGPELYDTLRERYHLQPEMKAPDYVLLMTSVADTAEGFRRLSEALTEIDAESGEQRENSGPAGAEAGECRDGSDGPGAEFGVNGAEPGMPPGLPPRVMEISEAADAPSAAVPLAEAAGRISADYVIVYPPDSPLIVPGEKFTPALIGRIRTLQKKGLTLTGIRAGLVSVLERA